MLKQLVEQISPFLGFERPPPLEEDGSFTFLLEPNLRISLRENEESGITFLTKIAPLPQKGSEEYLQRMMEANLLGKETGRAMLGLDQAGKEITFTLFLPSTLSYKEFHDSMEDFTNYAEVWREETLQFVQEKGHI
jgi:hypothetical protein